MAHVADLADLDYDALLAAGAAHRQRQQAAGSDSADVEEQSDEAMAVQLASSKRRRSAAAAAARAAVEDDHFKLGKCRDVGWRTDTSFLLTLCCVYITVALPATLCLRCYCAVVHSPDCQA